MGALRLHARHVVLFLFFFQNHVVATGWMFVPSPLRQIYRTVFQRRRRRRRIVFFRSDNSNSNSATTADANVHEYFMTLALDEARKAAKKNEVPIGAVVVRPIHTTTETTTPNNQTAAAAFEILACASNRVERDGDASAHAELLAMRQASKRIGNWRLLNATLYSTLEPCPMCLAASQAFRISSLVYGAPDLRLGAVETHMRLLDDVQHPFHNVTNVVKGIHANESSKLLKDFFRRRREKGSNKQQQSTETS